METIRTKKMSLTLTLAALAIMAATRMVPDTYYQALLENDFIKSLKQKLSAYNEQSPEDRLYLQLDKPFYEPGDDIWLSAYIRDGITLKPSTKSDIVYMELLNPKGTVEKRITVIGKNGKAAGDFSLGKEALGGLYKIRAYTNWMKNEGENNVFEKEIQVQDIVLPNLKMKLDFERKAFGAGDQVIAKLELNTNENKPLSDYKIKFVANLAGVKLIEQLDVTDNEGLKYIKFSLPKNLVTNDGLLNVMIDYNGSTESISRAIPIVLNTIEFSMYPEGGDLVSGLDNNVAFRAFNEFGKPADVEGVVVTEKGSRVAAFSSYYQGMGAFKFVPQQGESYSVKITKPEGVTQTFKLPTALERGYVMNLDNSKTGEVKVNVSTTETEELSLVAQVRGKLYYSTVLNALQGNNTFVFPTQNFPMGVAQVTLFDSKGIARAERLAFVNKNKQMNISVETEKEKYLPREKVKMTILVKDERGLPMPANLSMAVVNDQLLSFADDKSGNILSQLVLQQDIKEKIEEPAFYFNKKEAKADKALDYLLMTAGWRRFTWEKVLASDFPRINFLGQKAIINGSVFDAQTNQPIAHAKISATGGGNYTADENGKFSFSEDLTNPVNFNYSAEGYVARADIAYNYDQSHNIYLQSVNYKPIMYENQYTSMHALGANSPVWNTPATATFSGNVNAAKTPAKHLEKKVERRNKQVDSEMEDEPHKQNEDVKLMHLPVKDLNSVAVTSAGVFVPQDDAKPMKEESLKIMSKAAHSTVFMADGAAFVPPQATQYYRTRQFASPDYGKKEAVETRTDFRNTIYWNPDIEIGFSGKKTIEFYTSDDITSFKTTVEGIGSDGMPGRVEKNIFTQLPFAMTTKIPVEVATEDLLSIPLTLKNNTSDPLGGVLTITAPEGLQELGKIPTVQTIMPGKAKTIYLDYKVLDKSGYGEFTIGFKSCGLNDAFTQNIKIVPKGFPTQLSFSAQEKEKVYEFEIDNMVKGSLKASFTAFPNVISDLMKGVEGILQEPYGCFEQTSCTAYPNAMVLDYMKTTDSKDSKTLAHASDLLDRGYKRLTTFETKNKGYEWFGASPAHEGLTAYGIMEFVDMKNAGQEIDEKMLERTAQWLMAHRDGKGGFAREQRALHDFGRISDDVMNAYIVYALSEAGYTDIKKEFETSYAKAMSTKDPYLLAMMVNAAYSMKEISKEDNALKVLLDKQAKNGSFTGDTHSITYSQGQSLTIETTALSIMAMLKAKDKNAVTLNNAVHYLIGSRSGSGVFSSTQGTILALKSLTEYAKFSKKTTEDGTIVIYVDDKKVAERSYKAGDKGEIAIEGLEAFIKGEGKHSIKIKYPNVKTALPYSVAMNWNTFLPKSDAECNIGLQTKLASKTANVGETVRLTATITNKKQNDVPSVMAIIGIPAGFTAQPWQLKELQEKHVFDYYEIKGNNIAVYYRGMGAGSVKEINLDLKAEMPGEYDAPASSAYLYYTNEFKSWSAVDKVVIKKVNS